MRCAILFSVFSLGCSMAFADMQTSSGDSNCGSVEEQSLAPYLKDLEELGYCVIPQILSVSETENLYERVWHEFIEKAWPNCRMDNRSNWKEAFPLHNKRGIFAGPAGQIQVMWDLRQDPRIVDVFAYVWNTEDLIVSMDGLSLMCPPEIREGYYEFWPHVDQTVLRRKDGFAHSNHPPMGFVSESALSTKPFTIQGQFLFEDSFEGDGGFYCIPKSHLRFEEFAPHVETIDVLEVSSAERRAIRNAYFREFFGLDEGDYCMKQITAPRGSLILWDSRTIHWNQHASKDRLSSDQPKMRMIGYLCYVPKARLTDEGRAVRREAFEQGVATGHNPARPELKYSKDHIAEGFEQYFEDPSYLSPKIHLTPLGEAVLGINSGENSGGICF